MISTLKGIVTHRSEDTATIEVGGIGYEVSLPVPELAKLKMGALAHLYTHEVIRDDRRELFGFGSREELEFFRKMISVSGVGPRTSLHVLSLGIGKVREAIGKGDATFLSSAPGVGTKTAQKIVLELKGVIADITKTTSKGDEIVDALVGLGYGRADAADAVAQLPAEIIEPGERLRAALKIMGKR